MSSVDSVNAKSRFRASMVLSAVGDALGYRNGEWEFLKSGIRIHEELGHLKGLKCIDISGWRASDDTVMHIATAKGILDFEVSRQEKADNSDANEEISELLKSVAMRYLECRSDLSGRDPGLTCISSLDILDPENPHIPFNPRGGGCGAAMRAMCIGLRYSKSEDRQSLIELSIEAGRMTHHHPTGYLGSFVTALFTAYAIQDIDHVSWGCLLLKCLEKAKEYVSTSGYGIQDNLENWEYFSTKWTEYLMLRNIEDGQSSPKFPSKYGVPERDEFYNSISFDGWGGASGHDAPIIAYDALLGSKGDWIELCNRAMFHGGDSDSTGVIAGAWYGALYGFGNVPTKNYEKVEFRDILEGIADKLYLLKIGQPLPSEKKECSLIQTCRNLFNEFLS